MIVRFCCVSFLHTITVYLFCIASRFKINIDQV